MEARLLRTLSDSSEPPSTQPQDTEPTLSLAVLDMFVAAPEAGMAADHQLMVPSPASESSKAESGCEGAAMGEEDEGFDEEFCDSEEPPLRPPTNHLLPPLHLQELNNADLQTLLADGDLSSSMAVVPQPPFPTPSLLDDIDPGVFVTEIDSTHSLLGGEMKSPLHSPFPLSSPSPVCATLNSMTLGDSQAIVDACSPSPGDEWGTHPMLPYPTYSDAASSVGDSEYSSTIDVCNSSQYFFSASSLHSPSPTPSSSGQQYSLDMLSSLCAQDARPQTQATHFTCHSPSPSPSYHHSPSHLNFINSYGAGGSPTHSSPPPSSLVSPYHQPQSSANYGGTPLVSGQLTLMHGGAPSPSPHGTTTGNFASCSTQTPLDRTPSPAPSTSHAHLTTTTTESDVPKSKSAPAKVEKLVHMPYYKFKKILDSPGVPEERKSNIKNVRRRGKNKIAAKMCRQRKQEMVLGLQQEVDGLRSRRDNICVKTGSLEREIAQLKNHCLALYRNRQQQQPLPH